MFGDRRKDVTFKYVSLEEALQQVKPGDLIQYRGKGLVASWIKLVTGGVHSHSAMVVDDWNGELIVGEMREFKGGRLDTLKNHYKKYQGQMDVYGVNLDHFPEMDLEASMWAMYQIAMFGKYSYSNLLRILVRKVPFLWRAFDRGFSDDFNVRVEDKRWHCSGSVAASYQYGGVDPVPNMPNDLVAPTDLSRSLLFKYKFSL